MKNGKFDEKDGAAGLEETILEHLVALPEEERRDPEKREEIFNAVLLQGHKGATLCEGVLAPKRSRTSSKSKYEAELADFIAQKEEESRAQLEEYERHKEKQEAQMSQLRADLQRTQEVQAELPNALKNAGVAISIPSLGSSSPGLSSGGGSNSRVRSPNDEEQDNRHSSRREEDVDFAVTQARRERIDKMAKLFDMVLYLFQSTDRSILSKKHVVQSVVSASKGPPEEVVEMIHSLLVLVPEWIFGKRSSTGKALLAINKEVNLVEIRASLEARIESSS